MPEQLGPKLLNFASDIAGNTVEQAKSHRVDAVRAPARLADARRAPGQGLGRRNGHPHQGRGHPGGVGVDIGCGMVAAKTRFTEQDLSATLGGDYRSKLPALRQKVQEAIPLFPGNYNKSLQRFSFTAQKRNELLALQRELDVDLSHSPKWMQQLGSLGGGDHFIELCLDADDYVWLFLHSGSRGVGNKIAQRHIKIALDRQRSTAKPCG